MQTDFASVSEEFDQSPIDRAEEKLLEALRFAVAEISIKELSFRLNVKASLLSDALAERSSKGVRASWLITIIDMCSVANAIAITNALLTMKQLEAKPRKKVLTGDEKAERLEEKFRTLGPMGLRLIAEALGEEP